MELLTDRDPGEARRILDPVLERMMEAVHRYDGTVNQVMGDGIMAVFDAPLTHEPSTAIRVDSGAGPRIPPPHQVPRPRRGGAGP